MSWRRGSPFRFDIEASVAFAVETLQRANVVGALIGTARTWFDLPPDAQYQTKDIDIAIREEDAAWVEKALRDMGVEPSSSEIGGVCVELPAKGIKVDFIDRRIALSGLFREALRVTQERNDTVEFGETKILSVPLEYLVAMKLVPAREKDDLVLDAMLREAEFEYDVARDIVERHLGPASANRLDAMARRAGRSVKRRNS